VREWPAARLEADLNKKLLPLRQQQDGPMGVVPAPVHASLPQEMGQVITWRVQTWADYATAQRRPVAHGADASHRVADPDKADSSNKRQRMEQPGE
jgi:hypothetical protein